ncbi:MAG TPA: protein kinase [Thermoanaerobaculia bacterium]|nr:protein kinase [Thermoanaerobaculia bacterium]
MHPADFRGTSRFAVQRRLGAGGFGVVYAVRDTDRDTLVALKTLRHLTPDSLYRFKREFRALADINHPNLVQLYELFSDSDEWFFTMELVDGRDFVEHVWSGGRAATPRTELDAPLAGELTEPKLIDRTVARAAEPAALHPRRVAPADIPLLERSLRYLVKGVAALHRAGNIHRDLKPSNVLVTSEGRVVVLDFGLVLDIDADAAQHSLQTAGTPAYMSPEQAAGLPLTPASDWYSVGVMLYQALSGRLPFEENARKEMLEAKQKREPPRASLMVSGVPEHLDTLCRDLLRRDVAGRPDAEEIVARLKGQEGRAERSRTIAPESQPRSVFVGREKQLSALGKAMDDASARTVAVCLSGPSGMGKSSLARTFLDRWRERNPDTVILTGRCYERESVPYKALDSFIDALTRYLTRLPELEMEGMLPRDALALAQLFPVLRQLEERLPARRRTPVVPDAQELRRRAFAALREMTVRVAERRPVIIFIDDLQWGDTDSADLLQETLREPDSPPLLFIAAYRSDEVATSPFLRAFVTPKNEELLNMREVLVDQLSSDESRRLAAALLHRETPHLTATAATIAAEAGGSPFFIDELVRSNAIDPLDSRETRPLDSDTRETTVAEMIQLRVARLSPEARHLLELVAVNGQPIPAEVLKNAARVESWQSPLALLKAEHFVRTREREEQDELETYHDRIRDAVVRSLTADVTRAHHATLAAAFQSAGTSDPEILAEHFSAAGDDEKAIEYSIAAAQNAERALAFDHATDLYRRVLDLLPADSPGLAKIQKSMAEALVNAGRGAEAARVFLSINASSFVERLMFRQRAAQQYLFSGHIDEGLSIFRDVLQSIRLTLPEAPWRTRLALLIGRARVRLRGLRFRERDQRSIPSAQLVRIDASISVAVALSNVDTVRGAVFQALNFVWALNAGEIHRLALAFSLEAVYASAGGARNVGRTHRVLDRARQLTERAGTSYAKAFLALCSSAIAQHEGHWRDSVAEARNAESLFREHCKAVAWGIDSSWFYDLHSSYYLGDLRAISARYSDLLNDATDRGDLYAATTLRAMLSHYVHLAADDPAEALRDVQDAMSRWSQSGFHHQHLWEFWSSIDIALYEGKGALAWTRMNQTWPALKSSPAWHVQFTRMNVLDLRGKAALAAAESLEFPANRDHLLKEVERAARRLEREGAEWACAVAALLMTGIAVRRGNIEEAVRELEELERAFSRLSMALHAAVVQRRRGALIGGSEGASLFASSDEWMRGQKIADPEKFSYVIAPWRPTDPAGA